MIRYLELTLILGLFFSAPSSLRADTSSDIQKIISDQLAAFLQNDLETAFEFASPSIQGMFMSPDNFGRMVKQGYPMVWRQKEFRFLGLTRQSYGYDQIVMFKDLNGRSHYLKYAMTQLSDGWRINGVVFLKPSDFSA